ncbi:MAG: ketopantoate reductase family protein [Xanthobacteraceae bacterium]|nr:ketopantoate reductase family protein [Xanthobacteraceae bacterium]QYK44001.1 MAG: ketopantoate reductase family protein [Xanthobacteraceae bacterium]
MRIAVMATGALGAYFGGRLAEAGHEVHFIARGAHGDAIARDGLKVESPLGNMLIKPANVTDDPKRVGAVDVVLFAVKLWDTEKAGELSKPFVNKDMRVLSMLNGIDSVDRLTPILGDVVCGAPTQISAVISGPGVVSHKSTFAKFSCGFLDGRDDARLKSLVDEMRRAKIDAEFSTDIRRSLWQKFVFLVGISGATASTRSTMGPILADPDTRALLESLMRETEAVGIKSGVAIEGEVDKRMAFASSIGPHIKASMLEDLERGNRLELDWLQGKVVELGKKLGVPAPANEYVYKVLKLLRNGKPA